MIYIKPPIADTYIVSTDRANPKRCYYDKELLIGRHKGKYYRTLLIFDMSFLPQFLPIINVTMRLYFSQYENVLIANEVEVYQVISKYNPRKISWQHHPLIAGNPVDVTELRGQPGMAVNLDLTTLAAKWYSGAEANFGVLIKASDETSGVSAGFCSREWDDARCWPVLEVHYAQPDKPGCEPTLDMREEFLATSEYIYSATLDVLLFNYTYELHNRGGFPVEASLQLSLNGTDWSVNVPNRVVAPHAYEVLMPDTITRYARLKVRTLEPGHITFIQVYTQGRMD